MNEHVRATLNSETALEVHVELHRGGHASRFEAVLPPSAEVVAGPAELEIADGETRRRFLQFEVDVIQTTGDGRVTVSGSDLRRDWQRQVDPPKHGLSAKAFVERLFQSCGLESQAPRLPGGLPPAPPVDGATLGTVFENLLSAYGLTCTVNDMGELLITPSDVAIVFDESRLIDSTSGAIETPSQVEVVGGAALELIEITDWEAVLPIKGELKCLDEVLADWGVDIADARQGCLSDGGFEQLLPKTGPEAAERLATLKRFAYHLFRATDETREWIPVGGVTDTGVLSAPSLVATIARANGVAPHHPNERALQDGKSRIVEEFELDADAGTVYLPRPPYRLLPDSPDDPTFQARHLVGEPRIALTIAKPADREAFSMLVPGDGTGESITLQAAHLVALYDVEGNLLNHATLRAEAQALAAGLLRDQIRRELTIAGTASALATGMCEQVRIECTRDGLVSRLSESPVPTPRFAAPVPANGFTGQPAGPAPSGLYQPINAYRAGPLVLRTSGETPEGEAVVAMEAAHRDRQTGALTLNDPGPLAFSFFLSSTEPAKFGRWFFVSGVEVATGGRLRVLAPDDRHAEIPPRQFFEARHVLPSGMRGLIVGLGADPEFVDTGPLISDIRGRNPGASSSLVYDLDASDLSARKRGGFQFLSALALSPAHRDEGTRDKGWVPALNLREGETGNPEALGRGLFAEGRGHDLGRLTAKFQGGPILSDGAACRKHLYGTASDDDGLYRETAGHISTDAFFKVPGDAIHDAPVKFYAELFDGAVPAWRPYEAQIKYDANEQHDWNRTKREGRWKIQYRVPFLPEIPPTWDPPIGPPNDPPVDDPPKIHVPVPSYVPYDIRPAISEYELWAPSHDWVPAPSDRTGGETAFPGPSIKAQGWAAEVDGVPDPTAGGGCIYLPPGVAMPNAQTDGGTRQTFLALHPEVALALGHPDFGNGRIHSGWAIQLAGSSGNLELLPRDTDSATPGGTARGVHITGHLAVGPDGANFDDTQALRLGEEDDEGIAFGEDVQLYRDAESTLRTDADVEIGGKLTVEGLIDPTGLELDPQASNPGGTPGNTLWIGSGDSRMRVGSEVLAYASEIIANKRTEIVSYIGSGESGTTVTLTGVNRAQVILIFRDDSTTEGCVIALPLGATGHIRDRNLSDGTTAIVLNLNAPGTGAQTLTINSNTGSRNANGVPYKLLVIGTP